jgi:hypothetical protein
MNVQENVRIVKDFFAAELAPSAIRVNVVSPGVSSQRRIL